MAGEAFWVMARLSAFIDSERLSFADVLAEFRDGAPLEGVSVTIEGDAAAGIPTFDDAAAAIEQAKTGCDSHICEFERQCYEARGIQAWKEKRGELVQVYRCGWQSTNVGWCVRRKRFLLYGGENRHG